MKLCNIRRYMDDNVRIDQQHISFEASERSPVSAKAESAELGRNVSLGPPVKEQTTAEMRAQGEIGTAGKVTEAALIIFEALGEVPENILQAMQPENLIGKALEELAQAREEMTPDSMTATISEKRTEGAGTHVRHVTSQPTPRAQMMAHAATAQYVQSVVVRREGDKVAEGISNTLKTATQEQMRALLKEKREGKKETLSTEQLKENKIQELMKTDPKDRFRATTKMLMELKNDALAREIFKEVEKREKSQTAVPQEIAQNQSTIPEAPPIPREAAVFETATQETSAPAAPTPPTMEEIQTAQQGSAPLSAHEEEQPKVGKKTIPQQAGSAELMASIRAGSAGLKKVTSNEPKVAASPQGIAASFVSAKKVMPQMQMTEMQTIRQKISKITEASEFYTSVDEILEELSDVSEKVKQEILHNEEVAALVKQLTSKNASFNISSPTVTSTPSSLEESSPSPSLSPPTSSGRSSETPPLFGSALPSSGSSSIKKPIARKPITGTVFRPPTPKFSSVTEGAKKLKKTPSSVPQKPKAEPKTPLEIRLGQLRQAVKPSDELDNE